MEEASMDETNNSDSSSISLFKAFLRKKWVDNRENIAEWYRVYFHTIIVTLLVMINLWLGLSSFMLFFAQWFATESGPHGLALMIDKNAQINGVLVNLFNLVYVPLDNNLITWAVLVLNLPLLNWLYSTNTQPIMKGYTTLISWTSRKGRIAAAILSGIPFLCSFSAIFAWYVRHYLFDFFAGIKSDKDYLQVHSMESFGYVLMSLPIFLEVFAVYFIAKDFYRNEDLQKSFYNWEFSWLASQSFSLRGKSCDVIVGWETKTNKPIVLKEKSRYLHELIVGATGTGKTSTTILIRIVQDLIRIARGRKMGIVVLEPKGDLVHDVLELCEQLGIRKDKIKVVDPTNPDRSIKFNPYIGPLDAAASTYTGVINALAGDQDQFFKEQQNETAGFYTLLGKIRYDNKFSVVHMQQMYTDPRYLADITEEVRTAIDKELNDPSLQLEQKLILQRYERVVRYFEDEILDYKTYRDKEQIVQPVVYPAGHKYAGQQIVDNKKDKFVTGGKKYLNDIVSNVMLSRLMVANDDEECLDIDQFLQDGGVLLVNTALGELEELSLMFGQFFIRQFQSSVFRRPKGTGKMGRCPIFFYIDEFPLYVNEAFVRLLTVGRSYLVGTLIAIQSLGQLKDVAPGYDLTVLGNCRNKTVFGGGIFEDNEVFSNNFGEEPQVEESMNESTTPVSMPNQSWGMRYNTSRKEAPRFTPTQIKEQEFKHFIVDLVDGNGSVKAPVAAFGKFVPETSFIQKFVDIGKIEFETKHYKPLDFSQYKLVHATLLRNLFSDLKSANNETLIESASEGEAAETINTENVVEMLPTTQDQLEEELPIDVVDTPNVNNQNMGLNNSQDLAMINPAESEEIFDELLIPIDQEIEQLPSQPNQQITQLPLNEYESTGAELSEGGDVEYSFFDQSPNYVTPSITSTPNRIGEGSLYELDEGDANRPDAIAGDETVILPRSMEKSIGMLFTQLAGTDIEGKGTPKSDSEWTLADVDVVESVSNDVADSVVRDSAPSSTETEILDAELLDLVAENKKEGQTTQQRIAASRIAELVHTEVDDD